MHDRQLQRHSPGSVCELISQLLLWWQCLLPIYKPRPSDEMFYSCKVKPLKRLSAVARTLKFMSLEHVIPH